jgi:hypothetical protein
MRSRAPDQGNMMVSQQLASTRPPFQPQPPTPLPQAEDRNIKHAPAHAMARRAPLDDLKPFGLIRLTPVSHHTAAKAGQNSHMANTCQISKASKRRQTAPACAKHHLHGSTMTAKMANMVEMRHAPAAQLVVSSPLQACQWQLKICQPASAVSSILLRATLFGCPFQNLHVVARRQLSRLQITNALIKCGADHRCGFR